MEHSPLALVGIEDQIVLFRERELEVTHRHRDQIVLLATCLLATRWFRLLGFRLLAGLLSREQFGLHDDIANDTPVVHDQFLDRSQRIALCIADFLTDPGACLVGVRQPKPLGTS